MGSGVFLTATSGWLIVQASKQPVILTLLTAVVGVRAFGIGRPVFRYAERIVSHDAALATLRDRRTTAYRGLIPLTPARLGRRRRADLLTGVVRDLDDEVDLQVRTAVPLIATGVATIAALAVAFRLNPAAGLVVAAFVVVSIGIGALDFALERRGQQRCLAKRAALQRAAHPLAADTMGVQAIGAGPDLLRRLDDAQRDLGRATSAQARGRALGVGLSLIATGFATVALALLLAGPARDGKIGTPVAALLVFLPLALGDVLGSIPDAVGALARGRAARQRLHALLDQPAAVIDNATDQPASSVPLITLREASAGWSDDAIHLAPLDLTIQPGEHLTVIGRNGVGKSTLLAVLARQLDPAGGSYALDGRDVRGLSAAAVRDLIAVVDDDPHLFVGSVRANLLLARPDASDRDVAEALVDAGLGGWLAGLPNGLDTTLGAGHRGVSGGERARFGVARALLSRRPVLLLDEPVAHLDTPTARAVLDDLHAATRGRSVVLVAHQAVGARGADRVLDLTDRLLAETTSGRN
ncbi:hypothetical protein GCM10027579_23220 [Calidifontibacter terrae]